MSGLQDIRQRGKGKERIPQPAYSNDADDEYEDHHVGILVRDTYMHY